MSNDEEQGGGETPPRLPLSPVTPPVVPTPPVDGDQFSAVRAAAAEHAKDPQILRNDRAEGEGERLPAVPLTETYEHQVALNMKENRRMRWLAFAFGGGTVIAFLWALLATLARVFLLDGMPAAIQHAMVYSVWHAYAFATIGLVVFAVIPLTFAVALMRMISDKETEDVVLKTPAVEAVTHLIQVLKEIFSKR